MGVNSLPKTVTLQRRDCDLNPGLLRLSPARLPLCCRVTPCSVIPKINKVTDCLQYLSVCPEISFLALARMFSPLPGSIAMTRALA